MQGNLLKMCTYYAYVSEMTACSPTPRGAPKLLLRSSLRVRIWIKYYKNLRASPENTGVIYKKLSQQSAGGRDEDI